MWRRTVRAACIYMLLIPINVHYLHTHNNTRCAWPTSSASLLYRNGGNDLFIPQTISRPGASSPIDCLSQFSQLVDGAFYLPLSSSDGTTLVRDVPTFAECVALCNTTNCQYVTYAYVAKTCTVRVAEPVVMVETPWIAFKAIPAGYMGASAWSVTKSQAGDGEQGAVKAQGIGTGVYTFFQVGQAGGRGVFDAGLAFARKPF